MQVSESSGDRTIAARGYIASMPELPDVEGYRRLFDRYAVGKLVVAVVVRDAGVIRSGSSGSFVRRLVGRRFAQVERVGKWLLAPTDGPTLLIHFGMTGALQWLGPDDDQHRFDRVLLQVDGGELAYRDQRKLRGLWLADEADEITRVTGPQGPDAAALTGAQLEHILEPHRGELKSLLMNQELIAGLGNMLTDEVLWRAKIHPCRVFADLEQQERRSLGQMMERTLRTSIKHGEIPRTPRWLSSQRAVDNPRCPRCRATLCTSRVAGRTSLWCPVCQPSPRGSARPTPSR